MRLPARIYPVFLILFLISCSKSSPPPISIAGTWIVASISSSDCNASTSNGTQSYVCPATTTTPCSTYSFNSNGTFAVIHTYYDNGTSKTDVTPSLYAISGNKITITPPTGSAITNTFTLSGNTLTMTSAKDATTGCISTIVMSK